MQHMRSWRHGQIQEKHEHPTRDLNTMSSESFFDGNENLKKKRSMSLIWTRILRLQGVEP